MCDGACVHYKLWNGSSDFNTSWMEDLESSSCREKRHTMSHRLGGLQYLLENAPGPYIFLVSNFAKHDPVTLNKTL